jgi:ribosome biogenesis ATPase
LEGDFDFAALAKATPGYVGADLQALITTAGVIAVKRIFKHLRLISLTQSTTPLAIDNGIDSSDTATTTVTTTATTTTTTTAIDKAAEESNAMDIDDTNPVTNEQEDMTTTTTVTTMTTAADDMPTIDTSSTAIQTTSVEEFESQTALEQLRAISDFIKAHQEPLTPAQLESLAITQDDFQIALTKVQPSSKREGFATVPDVSWDDIGALQYVRDELRMAVVEPINHPEFFERVGITNPAGVLLWGPPGCGKTLLAKAVANESNTNFISVKGPELLNKVTKDKIRRKLYGSCMLWFIVCG